MITVSRLTHYSDRAHEDINGLLPQLSSSAKPLAPAELKKILSDENNALFVVWDGTRIVGMGTIVLMRIPMFLCAWMEDVVIGKEYRNRGLGSALVKELIAHARAKGAVHLNLTSRRNRKKANQWYLKMGFIKREANVYRISL
ncbi:MAG: GCN5-like N-acetyltransferase [Parcubacteria group bacterium Gr01-1014_33]|nr:MAG: GCN5-like N-acetyltransferase [Parcubacteria group bacterium Gr01-1014_33]